MEDWPGQGDARPFADVYARIEAARVALENLKPAVREFARETLARMAGNWSQERNTFIVNLPPANMEGRVNARIKQLCGAVTENLRAALDYTVVVVSVNTTPKLTSRQKKRVRFVYASNSTEFGKQAKTALQYVDSKARDWLAQLQHNNQILDFIRDDSNISKHHNLPDVRHDTEITVVLREDTEGTREQDGWWIFDAGRGHAFYTRAEPRRLILTAVPHFQHHSSICGFGAPGGEGGMNNSTSERRSNRLSWRTRSIRCRVQLSRRTNFR